MDSRFNATVPSGNGRLPCPQNSSSNISRTFIELAGAGSVTSSSRTVSRQNFRRNSAKLNVALLIASPITCRTAENRSKYDCFFAATAVGTKVVAVADNLLGIELDFDDEVGQTGGAILAESDTIRGGGSGDGGGFGGTNGGNGVCGGESAIEGGEITTFGRRDRWRRFGRTKVSVGWIEVGEVKPKSGEPGGGGRTVSKLSMTLETNGTLRSTTISPRSIAFSCCI